MLQPPDIENTLWRAVTQADMAALHGFRPYIHARLAGVVLSENSLAAVNDNRVVALAMLRFQPLEHEIRAYFDGDVASDFRDKGIGTYLIQWQEAHAREVFRKMDDQRPKILRYDFDALVVGVDAVKLYEDHGFAFNFAEDGMMRDLRQPIPDFKLPANMRVETWSTVNASQFFQVYSAAFRERPGFPNWTEAIWRGNFTSGDEFLPDSSLLIVEGNKPLAYAVCHFEDGLEHITQMGVHPDARGRGLGAMLLCELMRRFKAKGLSKTTLEVNVNNPIAARLYEKLGFVRIRRYTSYRKAVE